MHQTRKRRQAEANEQRQTTGTHLEAAGVCWPGLGGSRGESADVEHGWEGAGWWGCSHTKGDTAKPPAEHPVHPGNQRKSVRTKSPWRVKVPPTSGAG